MMVDEMSLGVKTRGECRLSRGISLSIVKRRKEELSIVVNGSTLANEVGIASGYLSAWGCDSEGTGTYHHQAYRPMARIWIA